MAEIQLEYLMRAFMYQMLTVSHMVTRVSTRIA